MIEIKNLKKTFFLNGNKIEVLKGFDLEISDGQSLAVVGVSGAGKSTLLHILGTLDHPTGGEVLFDGINVFSWPEKKLSNFRNSKIGFVFQFNNLLPEFTALENVMMPALIQRIPGTEAKKIAEKILSELGLSDRMKHKPGQLSGGEQQRVALARALILEPKILLADEPTGNLDTETGKKIEDALISLNQSKRITLIVVTHNTSLAERMSKRIGLSDGRIYTRG
jgi:lipoprotein-releasing system ATP-binding protein